MGGGGVSRGIVWAGKSLLLRSTSQWEPRAADWVADSILLSAIPLLLIENRKLVFREHDDGTNKKLPTSELSHYY